jgi:pilus assembly protein CpaF
MEGDVMSMHDIFGFKQTGVDEARMAQGYFFASGLRPHCLERLTISGTHLPPQMFERRMLGS